MFSRYHRFLTKDKQKNDVLKTIAYVSIAFAGIYLVMFFIGGLAVTWTKIINTSATIEAYLFVILGWSIDRIITIIFSICTTVLLIYAIEKRQKEDNSAPRFHDLDIISIIGMLLMLANIVIIIMEAIFTYQFLITEIPYGYTSGMFIAGKARIGINDLLLIFISIFCFFMIIHTLIDFLQKKRKGKTNRTTIILAVIFLMILIANSVESNWYSGQNWVYITVYILKFIGFSWFGVTALMMTE